MCGGIPQAFTLVMAVLLQSLPRHLTAAGDVREEEQRRQQGHQSSKGNGWDAASSGEAPHTPPHMPAHSDREPTPALCVPFYPLKAWGPHLPFLLVLPSQITPPFGDSSLSQITHGVDRAEGG